MAGSYWKTKVVPTLKKVFEKNSGKKAAAAEACKTFDVSKEEINKEFEEKKPELQTKVVEIYEASSTEIKTLVKERKIVGVKKHSVAVHKFLEDLVQIDFPGSKPVCEASKTFGPSLVSGPILFIFEKVSTFVVIEDKKETATVEATTTTEGEEITGGGGDKKDKEIVVEETETTTTKDEKVEEKEEEIKSTSAPAPAPEPEVVVVAEPVAAKTKEAEPAAVPACEPTKTKEPEPAAAPACEPTKAKEDEPVKK